MGESLPSQPVVVRRVVSLLCAWIPFPASVLWFQKELPGGAVPILVPGGCSPLSRLASHHTSVRIPSLSPQHPSSTLVFSVLEVLVTRSLVLWLFMYLACLSP